MPGSHKVLSNLILLLIFHSALKLDNEIETRLNFYFIHSLKSTALSLGRSLNVMA